MVERHHSWPAFMRMGVPEKTAYETPATEHDISEESLRRSGALACEYLQVECKR